MNVPSLFVRTGVPKAVLAQQSRPSGWHKQRNEPGQKAQQMECHLTPLNVPEAIKLCAELLRLKRNESHIQLP